VYFIRLCFVQHGINKWKQNILVNARGDACLSDFGFAIVNKGSIRYEDPTVRGHNSLYAAPETLKYGRRSKEADVFSYGLVAVGVRSFEYQFLQH
jgi:hypothetical protein